MIRYFPFIFSSVFAIANLTACGPSQTAQDAETEQQNINVAQEKAENDLVQGTYTGTMTDALGNKSECSLVIVSTEGLQPVANTNQTVEIPTLNGHFSMNGYVIEAYNSGNYNQAAGRLQMWTNSVLGGGGNMGSALGGVDVSVNGGHLHGTYFAPNLIATDLDLNKVQ